MIQSTAATDIDIYLSDLDEWGMLDHKWYGILDYYHPYSIMALCGCGAETEIMSNEMVGSRCHKCGKILFPRLTGNDASMVR